MTLWHSSAADLQLRFDRVKIVPPFVQLTCSKGLTDSRTGQAIWASCPNGERQGYRITAEWLVGMHCDYTIQSIQWE